MPTQRPTRRAGVLGLLAILALAASASLSGCAGPADGTATPSNYTAEANPSGDIPDNQAYVAYGAPSGHFSIKVPEGWAKSTHGSATTFNDKLNSITVAESASAAAPTVASARTDLVTALAAGQKNFALKDVAGFQRPAGPGVLITYTADSSANAVTGAAVHDAGEQYVFWKNGRLVTVTLTSPVGADNVDPWKAVTESFTWLS